MVSLPGRTRSMRGRLGQSLERPSDEFVLTPPWTLSLVATGIWALTTDTSSQLPLTYETQRSLQMDILRLVDR